jgi:3-oxoacyl-[acyl-carrier protein] reductase
MSDSAAPAPEPSPAPTVRGGSLPNIVATTLTSRPIAARTLQDRRALVIGGSRGIGSAIARRLAREGAHVAVTYASRPEHAAATVTEALSHGGKAMALHADSRRIATLEAAVNETVTTFGGLDILVHSAGVASFGDLRTIPLADLDQALEINLRGAYLACQAAARCMTRGGRIIVIGSVNSERVALPGNSLYAMTKSGLAGMVRAMARDLARDGITVNNVQPGPVDTEMNPAGTPFADMVVDKVLAIPRYGNVDEVAAMVAYVAGPETDYLTGASLLLDGGFAA